MSTQFQATLRLAHRSSSRAIQGHRPPFKAYFALQLTTTTFSQSACSTMYTHKLCNMTTWHVRHQIPWKFPLLRPICHPSDFQVLIPCRYTYMDSLTQLAHTMNMATTGKTQEHSCTVLDTTISKTLLTKFKTTYKLKLMSLSDLFLQPSSERRQNAAFNLTIIFERHIKNQN